MGRRVLITGGAGFIGSHTCLVLLEQGHELVVLDNFDNSSPEALRRVQELAGSTQLTLVEGDVRDPNAVDQAFSTGGAMDGVIHFAGLKAVGESVANPLLYWDVNVNGSRVLAAAMDATAAGPWCSAAPPPPTENPRRSLSGKTCQRRRCTPTPRPKWRWSRCWALCRSGSWQVACLRYFNPVGAHPGGRIGEDPLGIPNNLFPFITQVAAGRRERLRVFGQDYSTPDGTGIHYLRDGSGRSPAPAPGHLFNRQHPIP